MAYVIIVLVVLVIAGVIWYLKVSQEPEPKQTEKPQEPEPKPVSTQKRFKQVLADNDLKNTTPEEKEELLTKYSSGTGEGINEVEKLLEGDPNNVDLLDWLAFMYYSNDEIDKSIETYKRALDIKPDNENQHYYLANCYFKKDMVAEAKKEWNEVLRLKPNSKIAKNAKERIDYLNSRGK